MRSILWMVALTAASCTPAAFAADQASVNLPFSFAAHGKVFPASQYDVTLKDNRSFLTLTSRTNPADTITFTTFPVGMAPHDTVLSIEFDQVGNAHELRTVRLREYQTPVLDAHLAALKKGGPINSGQ
jgi:hypothetical protein